MSNRQGLKDLTIAWSILGERASNVQVPPNTGADTLLLVQGEKCKEVPEGIRQMRSVYGLGVAKSRNAAIEIANRRYLLFCDDDVTIDPNGVSETVAHLRATGAAIALGRTRNPDGSWRKNYGSDKPRALTWYNSAKAATYELIVDCHQIRKAGIKFDERFGAGTVPHLGDEFLFILSALRAGLIGHAVPYALGTHPKKSSGMVWDERSLKARALVLNEAFGVTAPIVRTAFALKHRGQLSHKQMLKLAIDSQKVNNHKEVLRSFTENTSTYYNQWAQSKIVIK